MAGRPKMCAACGKLMGTANECPYCGADNTKISLRIKRAAASQSKTGGAPATIFFIGVNLFLFGVVAFVGGLGFDGGFLSLGAANTETLVQFGAMYSPAVAAGDWWRLSMPVFLHGSLIHLGFNCFVAWTVGRHVEREFGTSLSVLIYLMSGIIGFLASYYVTGGLSVGASGAVAGMIGCILVRRWLVDGDLRSPIAQWSAQMVVLTAIMGFVVSGIDNMAHLGGLVTGVGFAFLLTKVRLGRGGTLLLLVTNLGTAMLCVAGAVLMLLQLGNTKTDSVLRAQACVSEAAKAVPNDANTIASRRVTAAQKCFEGLDVTGAREDLIDSIRSSLANALRGEQVGDTAMVQHAGQQIDRDARAWIGWLGTHYGKFYRLGPKTPATRSGQ